MGKLIQIAKCSRARVIVNILLYYVGLKELYPLYVGGKAIQTSSSKLAVLDKFTQKVFENLSLFIYVKDCFTCIFSR